MKNQNDKGHQGDAQFKSVALPKGLTKIEKKPIALGEKSGHRHVITGDYEMFEDSNKSIYVSVGKMGATLQHIHESKFIGYDTMELQEKADHNPVVLEPETNYVFGIHKKYNPFAKVWENVID